MRNVLLSFKKRVGISVNHLNKILHMRRRNSCMPTCMTTEFLHRTSRAYMMWHIYHIISTPQVLLLYCPKCYELTGHPCAPLASDYRGRDAPELARWAVLFSRRYFAFWHSCLSERKPPTLTSYSRIPQLPPSDFVPMNRYMERFISIRTYGITLTRLHAFPFLPDNA